MIEVMAKVTTRGRRAVTASAVVIALCLGSAMPAQAQDKETDSRLRKVEAEVRALQRKVFPGGDGKYFPPEIKQVQPTPTMPGEPATTAVTDILTRLDALEAQVAQLTGQVEQNSNRISQLEAHMASAQASATASPANAAAAPTPAPAPAPAPDSNLNAMSGGASATKPAPAPAAVKPSSARIEAVKAIVKPQTDDAGDDEYSYGYRLWEAKFFPEAEQQLQMFISKYPKHWRITWARNLLGRAYLDDGNPGEAAKWFLQNYQADKQGDRAPDSLLYLAVAMKQLKDDKRACIALAEFSETYASEAAGRLKGLYDSTRNGLKCN